MSKRSKKVIDHLRQNSRTSFAAIAREEKVTISTIFDHVKKLENTVIDKHTCLLNYPKLGFPFRTFFYCTPKEQNELLSFFQNHTNTNNVHVLSNGQVSADMIFSSMQEEELVKEFLEEETVSFNEHRILSPLLLEAWKTSNQIIFDKENDYSEKKV